MSRPGPQPGAGAGLPDRWCCVRLGHLGDVVLTTGVLDYWHRTRGWRFSCVTREANAAVFDGHPAVDEVVPVQESSLETGPWMQQCRGLAKRFQGQGLLDLHGTLRTRMLGKAWEGPVRRYPKFSLGRRVYLRTRFDFLARRLAAVNVPQRYALAVEERAPDRSDLLPQLAVAPAELERADALLGPLGRDDRPLALLHPYATHPDKAWPEDRWHALIHLLDQSGWRWAVLGRSTEPLGAPDERDFTNRTDLRLLCALLARGSVLVTGDSGPLHLAAGVGTPVVALFGPTNQAWGFYPAGPRDTVLETALRCRPCSLHGKSACRRDRECLRRITPEQVLAAAQAALR